MEFDLSQTDPDDEALARSARAGDNDAFDRLVERYAPRVFRMIRAQVGDPALAEDLVQETFLSAFVALPGFRFRSGFYTWLYRIAVNTVRQHQRKSARRRELDLEMRARAEAVKTLPEFEKLVEELEKAHAAPDDGHDRSDGHGGHDR